MYIQSLNDLFRFLHWWHETDREAAGLPEHRVPTELPDPLRRFYLEFGRMTAIEDEPAPFNTQDMLGSIADLEYENGMVTFSWENQGNWSCKTRLGEKDPPVFSDAGMLWDEHCEGFEQVCDSLEHFIITLALQETLMSCKPLWGLENDPQEGDLLIAREPLWLNGRYVSGEPDHQFHIAREPKAIFMEYQGFWLGSKADCLDRVLKRNVDYREIQ